MPTYDYRCSTCTLVTEVTHSIKDTPIIDCPACLEKGEHSPMERLISLNRGAFVIKQWTEAMAWKAKREKVKQNAELGVKQIERYSSGPQLQPNVAGMEVGSWSEAQKVAKESGMRTDTYEPMIEKEKRVSKVSGVDDSKWKAAKEVANKI